MADSYRPDRGWREQESHERSRQKHDYDREGYRYERGYERGYERERGRDGDYQRRESNRSRSPPRGILGPEHRGPYKNLGTTKALCPCRREQCTQLDHMGDTKTNLYTDGFHWDRDDRFNRGIYHPLKDELILRNYPDCRKHLSALDPIIHKQEYFEKRDKRVVGLKKFLPEHVKHGKSIGEPLARLTRRRSRSPSRERARRRRSPLNEQQRSEALGELSAKESMAKLQGTPMLAGPTGGDYFTDGHQFRGPFGSGVTLNESSLRRSLRTGLTPGESMFPSVTTGATPGTLHVTSQPQPQSQSNGMNDGERLYHQHRDSWGQFEVAGNSQFRGPFGSASKRIRTTEFSGIMGTNNGRGRTAKRKTGNGGYGQPNDPSGFLPSTFGGHTGYGQQNDRLGLGFSTNAFSSVTTPNTTKSPQVTQDAPSLVSPVLEAPDDTFEGLSHDPSHNPFHNHTHPETITETQNGIDEEHMMAQSNSYMDDDVLESADFDQPILGEPAYPP